MHALARIGVERAGPLNAERHQKENHVFVNTSSALIALLGSAIASMGATAAIGAADQDTIIELRGRCDYRDDVIKKALPGTGFAPCRSVRIEQNGAASVIDFRNSLGGSEFRYEGTWTGDGMAITRLSFNGRAPQDASGDCRIYRNAGDISTVSCVAKIDWKTFAANFVASRVNP